MIDYGKQKSTVCPETLVIDEQSVWVNSNIAAVEENIGKENEFIGFEFNMVQYEKDEYIKRMSESNSSNESTLDVLMTEIIPSMMGGV